MTARLLTHVDEALANVEPLGPLQWFRAFGSAAELESGEDRCLLVLGFDAAREENSVSRMVEWVHEFRKKAHAAGPPRFAATLFVLDWSGDDARSPAAPQLQVEERHRLVQAGMCYRPKDPSYYNLLPGNLAESLRRDLMDKHLLPHEAETALGEPVTPRHAPHEDDPQFKEAIELLGGSHLVWPPEAVRELFHR